jgi:RNA polymerase sigma-70 factor (ECF subfamily)
VGDRTDAELVTITRGGDSESYGLLVARYQGHVYGLAYSLAANWADAQDIAQETFIRAYINLHQLRDPARFAPWLRRVTFGVAMNWLRAFRPELFRHLQGEVDLEKLEIPDFSPGPPEVVERKELAEAVRRAISSLPPKYRLPLTMFHLDGLSYQKVADFLDIPLGTVQSLIHRARAKLKVLLAPYMPEEAIPMVQEVFNEHKLHPGFAGKVLDGISRIDGPGGWCPKIACYRVLAERFGVDVSLDYLAGVSGVAFRLQMARSGFCPSAPDPGVGFLNDAIACTALGLRMAEVDPRLHAKHDIPEDRHPFRKKIVESIENGLPAVGCIPVGHGAIEWCVIVGYEDDGRRLVCRTALDEGSTHTITEDLPVFVELVEEHGLPVSEDDVVHESLELAVRMARAETAETGQYWAGSAAYEAWIAGLLDDARFDRAEDEEAARLQHGNGWCYVSLMNARDSAAKYLGEIRDGLGQGQRANILRAQAIYTQIAEALKDGKQHVPWQMPSSSSFPQPWTRKMRQAQADVLKQALGWERMAIADIEAALGERN